MLRKTPEKVISEHFMSILSQQLYQCGLARTAINPTSPTATYMGSMATGPDYALLGRKPSSTLYWYLVMLFCHVYAKTTKVDHIVSLKNGGLWEYEDDKGI
jgi:hypothetical protein